MCVPKKLGLIETLRRKKNIVNMQKPFLFSAGTKYYNNCYR